MLTRAYQLAMFTAILLAVAFAVLFILGLQSWALGQDRQVFAYLGMSLIALGIAVYNWRTMVYGENED